MKSPSWRVGKRCCCHNRFPHIKSSENFLSKGRITKKILSRLKWPKSGCKSKEGKREDPYWLQLPVYLMVTGHLRTRRHPSGRGDSTLGTAGCPQKQLLGRALQQPGRSWGPWTSWSHAPCFITFSVNRKVGTAERKMPTGVLSLILYYSFTQTHPEVNPLNLDKRLNQVLILLFEMHEWRDCQPAQQSRERRHFKIPSLGSEVKASACNAGDPGWIPGSGRSPGEGNGNPLQYSCLENTIVHGVPKSWTRLSDFTFTFSILWGKQVLLWNRLHV